VVVWPASRPALLPQKDDSMQNRSSKPVSSKALKLSLVAVAGAAAGGMGDEASAASIVTANLNGTATLNNPIYFSYSAGTIGTSSGNSSIEGAVTTSKGNLNRYLSAGNVPNVNYSSPFAVNALIGPSSTSWSTTDGVYVAGDSGYWGVRFSAGGSDYNYGWVEVTYTNTGLTFGQASVETTINTAIQAGATAPVPEIDPASAGSAASLVAGVLAIVEQRRRRRVVPTGSAVA